LFLNNSKVFSSGRYGYVIVIFSFLIQAIGLSLIFSFGLFFKPLQAEFGWDRATISLASTLNAFVSGIASIITGMTNDRFGPRVVMTVHGILFGLGYLAISFTQAPWHLYLSYGIAVGIGQSAINTVLLPTIARWFHGNRGLMTGIIKAGAGLGIFIMPFIVTALIGASGTQWRNAALVLGIASAVIMAGSAQFLRRSPVGKDNLGINAQTGKNASTYIGSGLDLRQALKTRQFWMLCLVYASLMYTFQTMQLHIVPYAKDAGYSTTSAALVVSIIGIASIFGRIAFGYVGDRWGNKLGFILCASILIFSLIWLQLSHGLPMLYLFAVFYGIFHGSYTTLTSPMVANLFGTRNVGSLFGATQFFGISFGSLGGFLSGYFFDRLGNYVIAIYACTALAILALAVMSFIRPVVKSQTIRF
jgi:MFS family permease